MKYARLSSDNIVIEVFVPPPPFTIEDCFTPEIVAQFEPCPDEVEQNWVKNEDGTFSPPPPKPDPPPPPPDPPEPPPEPPVETPEQ
jgi:hypothetical protein